MPDRRMPPIRFAALHLIHYLDLTIHCVTSGVQIGRFAAAKQQLLRAIRRFATLERNAGVVFWPYSAG